MLYFPSSVARARICRHGVRLLALALTLPPRNLYSTLAPPPLALLLSPLKNLLLLLLECTSLYVTNQGRLVMKRGRLPLTSQGRLCLLLLICYTRVRSTNQGSCPPTFLKSRGSQHPIMWHHCLLHFLSHQIRRSNSLPPPL